MILLVAALLCRDEVADLIARLRAASDATARYRVGNDLEKAAKPAHVPVLLKEADAGPAAIRPQIIFALARLGTKEAVAALRSLAQNPKHDVLSRSEAAEQLIWLDDDLGLPVLIGLLSKASTTDDKRQVLYSLRAASAQPGEAIPAVGRFLVAEKAEELRRAAIEFLGSCKDPAALPILRKVAADEKDPVRFSAMAELVRLGDEQAFEDSLKALESGAADTTQAFHLLNAIERSGKKSALPRLRELLEKTEDKSLKTSLIRSLAELKDDKSLGLLNRLAEDTDPSISRAAVEAVLKLAGKGQLELLRKVASDTDPTRRLEAAETLLNLDLREGYDAIKAELESGKSYHRQRAVSILAGLNRRETVDLLLPLLDDSDAQLKSSSRSAVLKALAILYPYLKFDQNAPSDKLRAWWEKHRPKP